MRTITRIIGLAILSCFLFGFLLVSQPTKAWSVVPMSCPVPTGYTCPVSSSPATYVLCYHTTNPSLPQKNCRLNPSASAPCVCYDVSAPVCP